MITAQTTIKGMTIQETRQVPTPPKPLKKKKGSILAAIIPLFLFVGIIGFVCFTVYSLIPKGNESESYKKSIKHDLYEFTGVISKKWILKGSQFTQGETQTKLTVTVTEKYKGQALDMHWECEGTDYKGPMQKVSDTTYEGIIDSKDLPPNTYKVVGAIAKEGSSTSEIKSQAVDINVSYPLYSVWTIDWEGLDVTQTYLDQMDQLSSQHHNLPLVQLFNPRIYVGLSGTRANQLTKWVKDRHDSRGDEIGMHMHMWFDMVQASGVTPRTTNAWRSYGNGRDIPLSEYTYDESVKIFNWGKSQFASHGLPEPISFRAGGWFLDLDNLKALETSGFKIDTSGRDGKAWGDEGKLIASNWSLGPRTLPYHPSESNLNSPNPEPRLKIWEFPNNGRDSYNYSAEDMIVGFRDNMEDGTLEQPRVINFLTHPHWYNVDKPRLEKLFTEVDKHLYSEDNGPVIYTTLEKILPAWQTMETEGSLKQ